MDTRSEGQATVLSLSKVAFTHPPVTAPVDDPEYVAAGLVDWSNHLIVGGRTVWVDPPRDGIVMLQPTRFGMLEDLAAVDALEIPVTVMVRPELAGWVPLPANTVRVLDLDGEPATAAPRSSAQRLADLTDSLASRLTQIRGCQLLLGEPIGTVSVIVEAPVSELVSSLEEVGITVDQETDGLPTISLTVRRAHTLRDVVRACDALSALIGGKPPPVGDPGGETEPPRRRRLTRHPLP